MNRVDQLIADFERRCEAIATAFRDRGFYAKVIGAREAAEEDPQDMGEFFQLEITGRDHEIHILSFPYPDHNAAILPWARYFEPVTPSVIPENEQFVLWVALHFQSMGLLVLADTIGNTLSVRDALSINHKTTL